ncbi:MULTISPECIES: DUF475 domain-containing protein [Deefgea]|uniref:DUF475 domain-containing protein n=1 Tax=Deefgea chitinilytica TaxID=570276 RepID=A0ABS2CCY8_9NEIS|nr:MULTISPECIES: DUF475 domain-containing protein [Deefgea]MBM5572006.1 DUF475 domain-containing protein [Deefgea chitinilytica]MBM9889241.1 DUF475 domain-containing protein [Deefgea sp. CFH1-16]
MFHYFHSSLIVTLIGFIGAWLIAGWGGLWIAFNLALLETSLSFDNAVVNASVLKHWDEKWRKRFLLWGMLIAVFGMRVLFPLLIVAVIAGLAPLPGPMALIDYFSSGVWPANDVLSMAMVDQNRYASILTSAHIEVSAFGGAFLLLVFLNFFIDSEKKTHWFLPVEHVLAKLGKLDMAAIVLSLILLALMAASLPAAEGYRFLVAGVWGVIVFVLVDGLGDLIGDEGAAAKTGWAGFIYLEVLDASFSFDGVLGAFALTKNIFLIAIGLGIGAMFVRSFTILLVEKGTLNAFKYLEHGAFWAIGALAAVMLLAARFHIPEVITGGVAAVLIMAAGVHSWLIQRDVKQQTIS